MQYIFFFIFFIFFSCTKEVTVQKIEKTSRNTLGNNDLGGVSHHIDNYFYDLDESMEAQFLYYNIYMTRGANTIANESGLNPYTDTLNFRTLPDYVVQDEQSNATSEVFKTVVGLTPENIEQYATIYEMDETDCTKDDWCKEVLYGCTDATYKNDYYDSDDRCVGADLDGDGVIDEPQPADETTCTSNVNSPATAGIWKKGNDCSESVDVDFDFSYSISTITGQNVDSVQSPGSIYDILSPKQATFEQSWKDIEKLIWDNEDGRYIRIQAEETGHDSVTLFHNDDYYDQHTYIGIIDTNRQSVDDLMFVDRLEWERFDTTSHSSTKEITLTHTFNYDEVQVSENSPMFRINGDCNQNKIYDGAESYSDFGRDFCPDEHETGEFCTVIDLDQDGDILDESPCSCDLSVINSTWQDVVSNDNKEDCIAAGGYWLDYGAYANECHFDPNGDNWRDCGFDRICPGDEGYFTEDQNGSQGDGKVGTNEEFEKNGQYDYNIQYSFGETFIDLGNGKLDDAEFCFNLTLDDDGNPVCSGTTPFEDRNCNGKWDDAEVEDKGNGIWDDVEKFIDDGDGIWEEGEPLYTLGEFLQNFIVDYTDPLNPVAVTEFDLTTQVKLYYEEEPVSDFLVNKDVSITYSESFYDIHEIITTYTNKIIEYPVVDASFDDYYITKTRWKQDMLSTAFDENDIQNYDYAIEYSIPADESEYGYDYHIFKKSDNGDIIKMVHPEYFKYYGYFNGFSELDAGTWQETFLSEEVYINTSDGYLRAGEHIYSDTTIVTSVADYYVENLYEVEFLEDFDNNGTIEILKGEGISIPFADATFIAFENPVDTMCVNECVPSYYGNDAPFDNCEQGFLKNSCPPVDTLLTNVFKITKTKTITMIGTGLELGLRNTIWLGSAGELKPLGILRDMLEMRWSEPYWKVSDSQWSTISRLDLRSLVSSSSTDGLRRFFNPIKKIALDELENEFELDNDPYRVNPSYGMHRMRFVNAR